MTFTRIRVPQIIPLALLACVALLPVGCGSGEDVKAYKVPKTTEREKKDLTPPTETGEYRLLGLMVPADNPMWFFKYSGPSDEVAKYEADFDKLAASVKFNGPAALPDFTPPEGWERRPGRGDIVRATVVTKDGKQEVSLSSSGGGVETNLGRWVGQIGLKSSRDDEAKYTKVVDVNGGKALRVDLRGPNNPATKRGPFMGSGMPAGHP
jgi:hypothetical protein